MVAVAEAHRSVGMVSSYQLAGAEVVGDGLPFPTPVVSGREVCRRHLLESQFFLFGSPSALLYRADLVRSRVPFFDESALHADTDACYRSLYSWDLGFVHRVLTFKRIDNESISSKQRHLNPHPLDKFIALVTHGPLFLGRDEYATRLREFRRDYYRSLASGLLYPGGWAQFRYHQAGLKRIQHRLTLLTLSPHILRALGTLALNPGYTMNHVWRGVRRLHRRRSTLLRRVASRQPAPGLPGPGSLAGRELVASVTRAPHE
jgi:hypothetical protein